MKNPIFTRKRIRKYNKFHIAKTKYITYCGLDLRIKIPLCTELPSGKFIDKDVSFINLEKVCKNCLKYKDK